MKRLTMVAYKNVMGAGAIALLVVGVWLPAHAAGNFGTALAGWWQFDECAGAQAADASGQGNDGALQGAVDFTTDALQGCALNFTGPDGGIIVPHSPSLEPVTGTIEAWVKIDQLQTADIVRKTTNLFVRRNISGGFSVYGLRIRANGAASGFVANDDPSASGPWTFAISSPNLVTPGTWRHLALRWDGNTVDLFVDGALQASTPYDPVPGAGLSYNSASSFRLGVKTQGGGEFIGQLEDVRFYGRARSDIEIFTDYTTNGHKPAMP